MPEENPEIVVLISAEAEWRGVRQLYPQAEYRPSPYGEWFLTRKTPEEKPLSQPVCFFQGGWGKVAAAGSTQYVIDRWQPRLLINLGTCGGFEGAIERGDIILVDKTIIYDIIEQMGDPDAHIAHYSTECDLSWLQPPYPLAARRSLLVSGDRDLLVDEIPDLKARYGAVAGDWESGAIAYIAQRNATQFLILRGVTDLVGSGGGEAYGNLSLFEKAAMDILGRLIESLPAWLEKHPYIPFHSK